MNRFRHEARMGRSETDIFVGKQETLGRPLWDRRITTKLSFDVKVCQGFYWFRMGSRAGSFEVGDVLRIPYKEVVNFWASYAKRGLHEATALEIKWATNYSLLQG